MKTCTKCGIEYEATIEFFTTDKRRKDGLGSSCRVCDRKRGHIYYTNNKSDCNKRTHNQYFKNHEFNKQKGRDWYKANKEVHNQRTKQWAERNPNYSSDHYQRNKKRYNQLAQQYRLNNPDIMNASSAKRRATKLNQTPILTQDEKHQIEIIYKKSQELGKNWQVDHIIPLAKGGLHHPDNLQIVVKRYNLQKSDKLNFRLPTSEEKY